MRFFQAQRSSMLTTPFLLLGLACGTKATPGNGSTGNNTAAGGSPTGTVVQVTESGTWSLEQKGDSLAFRAKGTDVWAFAAGKAASAKKGGGQVLPGLGFATSAAGASGSVLGADKEAPFLMPTKFWEEHRLEVKNDGDTLVFRFLSGTDTVELRASPPGKDGVDVEVVGRAFIALPRDQTAVSGYVKGKQSFSFTAKSERASILEPRADRIEVKSRDGRVIEINGACPRTRLTVPARRGGQDAFLLALGGASPGGDRFQEDALFPPPHPELVECSKSAKSAVKVRWSL